MTSLQKRWRDDYRIDSTVSLSAIAELSLELGKAHQISSTTLLLRNTDDETGQFVGTNLDERSDVRVTRLRWVERELLPSSCGVPIRCHG